MPTETIRKIHFFTVRTENTSFEDALSFVSRLPEDQMYSPCAGGRKVYLERFDRVGTQIRGILRNLKLDDLPSVGEVGHRDVSSLNLPANKGLCEATHFIYFSERNLIGIEYNHNGPRASTLGGHLSEKNSAPDPQHPKWVTCNRLFNRDFLRKLDEIGQIKSMKVVVPKDRIERVRDFSPDLFDAFNAAKKLGETEEIEIVLKAKPRSRAAIFSNPEEIKRRIRAFFTGDNAADVFDTFQLRAVSENTDKVKDFDFLEDQIEAEVKVIKLGRGREIESSDMFEKIIQAYEVKAPQLVLPEAHA